MGSTHDTSLSVGTANVDLTPDRPVMLGGFGQRTTLSEGVLDPVLAKALHLHDAHRGERLLLITADLIAMPQPIADAVVQRLCEATALTPSQICLAASHSHSAPVPLDPSADSADRFSSSLVDALVDVGTRAIAAARPARLRTAVGRVDFLHNRWTRGTPNHVDDRVPVIVVDDASTGAPMSVLFGVGCHPVTLGWDSMLISADFPGVARRHVEERLGIDDALFINLSEGSTIPSSSPNRDSLDPEGYCGGSYDDTVAIGTALADAVLSAVERSEPCAIPVEVAIRRIDLTLPANNADLDAMETDKRLAAADATLCRVMGDDVIDRVAPGRMWAAASAHVIEHRLTEPEMKELMLATCLHLGLTARRARGGITPPVTAPVQVLRIGPFAFLALPGEPLVEVGDDWQRRSGELIGFVIGLANGYLRYLPGRAGFEAADATMHYETVTAGLSADGVEIMLDQAERVLATMR